MGAEEKQKKQNGEHLFKRIWERGAATLQISQSLGKPCWGHGEDGFETKSFRGNGKKETASERNQGRHQITVFTMYTEKKEGRN